MVVKGAQTDERLLGGYSGRILLAVTGGSLSISLTALVIPPLLPVIIDSFDVTPSQGGFVMTVWWFTVAMVNVPGGRLADEFSHKTGLVIGLTIASVGILVVGSAGYYLALLAGVAIVGVGRGFYQPSAIGQISDLFVARRGQALGLRNAAFNLGGVVAGGLATLALALATWRAAFIPIIAVTTLVLVLMHRWNAEPYVIGRLNLDLRATVGRLGGSRNTFVLVVTLSLFGFVWNGSTSFLPAYLQFSKGFSPASASLAYSGLFLVGALVQPLAGVAGDRYGYSRVGVAATTLCLIGLAGVLASSRPVAALVPLALFAMGLASFWPTMTAYGLTLLPAKSRAGDWGTITAVFLTMEALGSTVVGLVIEISGYDAAYLGLSGVLVVTILLTTWLVTRAD